MQVELHHPNSLKGSGTTMEDWNILLFRREQSCWLLHLDLRLSKRYPLDERAGNKENDICSVFPSPAVNSHPASDTSCSGPAAPHLQLRVRKPPENRLANVGDQEKRRGEQIEHDRRLRKARSPPAEGWNLADWKSVEPPRGGRLCWD